MPSTPGHTCPAELVSSRGFAAGAACWWSLSSLTRSSPECTRSFPGHLVSIPRVRGGVEAREAARPGNTQSSGHRPPCCSTWRRVLRHCPCWFTVVLAGPQGHPATLQTAWSLMHWEEQPTPLLKFPDFEENRKAQEKCRRGSHSRPCHSWETANGHSARRARRWPCDKSRRLCLPACARVCTQVRGQALHVQCCSRR